LRQKLLEYNELLDTTHQIRKNTFNKYIKFLSKTEDHRIENIEIKVDDASKENDESKDADSSYDEHKDDEHKEDEHKDDEHKDANTSKQDFEMERWRSQQ
jgi:hypothetical protein